MKTIFTAVICLWLTALYAVAESPKVRELREPEAATGFAPREAVSAQKYMAVTANPYATRAADTMLKQSGAAIDAAIAAQLVLTLVEPQSSGIGGGAFLLHWQAQGQQLTSYDGRETAPGSAKPGLFLKKDGTPERWIDAVVGGRSVGVPGVLKALELAHQKHGKLPWKKLFEPAIKLADEGFIVSPRLHKLIALKLNPGLTQLAAANHYFYPNGIPLAAGSVKKNPAYAKALRAIAESGTAAFYAGTLTPAMVKAINSSERNPGAIALKDFKRYRAKQRPPLCDHYRQYKVCSMGPPSSGGLTLLQILGLLEGYDLPKTGVNQLQPIHLFTQASRLAFADRDFYAADADFVTVPIRQLLDDNYIAKRRRRISPKLDMGQATPGQLTGLAYGQDDALEMPSTSHMSIIDSRGNAISMTTSIEMAFGSTVFANGYLLNNQLTDFSLSPTKNGHPVANRVEAGKRPRSSMTPVMVFDHDNKLIAVLGSPGGSRIINYVAHSLIAMLDWKLDIQQAISLPKASNRNGPTTLEQDTGITLLREGLEKLGHKVQLRQLNSGLHGIQITPKGMLGGVDPRREGLALGE